MSAPASASTGWNAGAWLGPQLGSTVWLLISAIVLAPRSAGLAAQVLALFLVPNLAGAWLWRARGRRSIFSAIQVFLLVLWPCSMAAVYVIDRAGAWRTLAVGGTNNVSAGAACFMLTVMVAALVLMFHLKQRALSRRGR